MAESRAHRDAKRRAAGRSGKNECPLPSGRRLDACTPARAIEVERSGQPLLLRRAAERLAESGKSQHVLIVPNHHMDLADKAMREVGVTGTVKNLGGTRSHSIRRRS